MPPHLPIAPPPRHAHPPFSLLFLVFHSVPIPGLDVGYCRGCARPGPVLAEPLEGPCRLSAERGESKEAPAVREGFLEARTPAVASAPPPPHLGHCPSSEPLSLEWPAGSRKRPLALQCRFQEPRLLAALAQDPFLEHTPRPTQPAGVSLGSWQRE